MDNRVDEDGSNSEIGDKEEEQIVDREMMISFNLGQINFEY